MDRRWKEFVRPVLALLIVGIIMGLLYIYFRVDDDVSANADTEIIVPNEENMEDNNMDKPPQDENADTTLPPQENTDDSGTESQYPIRADNGVIDIGGTYRYLVPLSDGYAVILERNGVVSLARIVGDECVSECEMTGKYIVANSGRYGIAIAVDTGTNTHVYTYDYECGRVGDVDIGACRDVRILENDMLTIVCTRNDALKVLYLDKTEINSILSIYNNSNIVATYSVADGVHYVILESGDIATIGDGKCSISHSLGYEICDIEPIMHEGKIAYAIVDTNHTLHIVNKSFEEILVTRSTGSEILYADTLYVLDIQKGSVDHYCTCGQYIGTADSDIAKVTYIDYARRVLYYIAKDGVAYSVHWSEAKSPQVESEIVYYIDDTITVLANGRVRIHA